MKKNLPWIVALAGAAMVAYSLVRPERAGQWHWREFGQIPVVTNGRVKPLDTVARTSLLVIHDKQSLSEKGQKSLTPIEWLAEVLFAPERANERKVFTIHDPEVIGLFGWQTLADEKHFSFAQLQPHFRVIDEQYRLANPVEGKLRSQFQQHIIELYHQLILFQSLKNTLQPEDSPDFARELDLYRAAIAPGTVAMAQRDAGQTYDQKAFDVLLGFVSRYRDMEAVGHFLAVPLEQPDSAKLRTDWDKMGLSLAKVSGKAGLHPVAALYAKLGATFRADDTAAFNTTLAELTAWVASRYGPELTKVQRETFFNRYEPFYKAMVIYVAVFILAALSWAFAPQLLGRTALALGCLAFIVQTSGLVFRVYLQNYPPVTNLYSAAVVVGWGAAGIGLLVEFWYRNAIGSAVAAVVGFCTLLVAHHLSLGGDTMEMMQAVLDSNFWLSVHVPTIVLGYSATFAAGAVGLLYIVLGVLTTRLTPPFGQSLYKIAYGIVCFATLLSFVGTVLGGIWADQSWGRFWGWDPKENGAALIVLWNAIILHSRWAGIIRERGLMIMSLFGNIVTAWSFFGTNLLGVGLHSYGFTSDGAFWLWSFMGSQAFVMALGALPRGLWRSPLKASPPPQVVKGQKSSAAIGR